MADAHGSDAMKRQRVLVVGLGTMGTSHARAYRAIDGFELVGLCTRNAAARRDLDKEFAGLPRFETLTLKTAVGRSDVLAVCDFSRFGCISLARGGAARGAGVR